MLKARKHKFIGLSR